MLVGVLSAIFVAGAQRFLPRYAQAELHMLSTAPRVYWSELWANDGERDPAHTAPVGFTIKGKYVEALPEERNDAATDFELTPVSQASGVITLRPAIASSGSGAVIWLCGNRPAPRGFVARGRNSTSLENEELMFSCRSRP
jgi:hypothetical protein